MKTLLKISKDIKTRDDYTQLCLQMTDYLAKTADRLGIPYYEFVELHFKIALLNIFWALKVVKGDNLKQVVDSYVEDFVEKTGLSV